MLFIEFLIQTVNIRKQKIVDQLAANRKQKNDLSIDTFRQRNFIAYHDQKNETLKDAVSHHQVSILPNYLKRKYVTSEVDAGAQTADETYFPYRHIGSIIIKFLFLRDTEMKRNPC